MMRFLQRILHFKYEIIIKFHILRIIIQYNDSEIYSFEIAIIEKYCIFIYKNLTIPTILLFGF